MIPEFSFKIDEIEGEDNSVVSTTFLLDLKNKRLINNTDGLSAIKQAISKILSTERQSYVIYNSEYGVEFQRFFGKDIDFVKSDLERTITEAIVADDRVVSIDNFSIDNETLNSLVASFEVKTVHGDIRISSEVKI